MHATLTRRQAVLRAAAVVALCGLALLQAIELPAELARARQVAVLSGLALVACAALAFLLAAAPRASAAATWGAVAALGAVLLGGWAASRAVLLPGLRAPGPGGWTTEPGLATAGLGLACVALAAAGGGARATRAAAATVVRAVALLAALAPAAGVLLFALGPGPHGGESTFADGADAHVHGAAAAGAFRPGFGGHAGHYVYPNATAPQLAPWALALAVGAAALAIYLAAATLRRRAQPCAAPRPRPRRALPRRVPSTLAGLAIATLIGLSLLGAAAPGAQAHASLLRSLPRAAAHVARAPAQVRLTFSEPVQVLRPTDVSIVDGRGRSVAAGEPVADPGDPRVVTIALRRGLPPDSYTVRYRVISDDSHEADDALVFALGDGRLRAPVLRGAGGLSETGPWAVAARFAELTALGLLLGLLAFRALVWGPALASVGGPARARAAGARLYWRAYWTVAAAAGLAEAGVLAAKSAIVFHTSVPAALADPGAAYRLVAASRFGDLLGWRSALLLALVAIAFWEWAREAAGAPAPAAGRPLPTALAAAASLALLAMLAAQGHASQAPLAPLSVLADTVHLAAAGIWIGGLPCLAAVLLRAPQAVPGRGRELAAAVAARFSRVALVAVALIVVTGALRLAGELSAVRELWSSEYGRSVLLKSLLLCPVALLGLRNRRAIARLPRAGAAALRGMRRNIRAELAIGCNIVAIAALLVAQVPGRHAPRARPQVPAPVSARSPGSPLQTGALALRAARPTEK